MKEHLYRILNIKFSESSQVFDLLIVQFFIGLANAFINIIAFTLFIYHFPIKYLPTVYLVIAGVLVLVNIIYQKLEHQFNPLHLLKYIIAFTAILLMVLWFGMTFGNLDVFIFVLLVSSVLIYMITGYAFWGLVSLLFNVRESRRVFSVVGAGDIPAKLIGYIAGPLLIPFIGMNNLIWLAILSLLTGIYLFNHFTKKKTWDLIRQRSMSHAVHPVASFDKKNVVGFIFKHKLIFAISLLSILSYNVFVLIDYTFISQVKLRFENISDLAAYIAIFFALGRLIALAFKLIFTSRVIERLGIISSLFITPVALFTFCTVFLIYGNNPYYNLYIFGIMAMMTEVLRSTMQEPVFFILFQPLKESLRLKGHIISKGYMYPPSLIIVGLSLLFLYNANIQLTIPLAIKIILLNLCIWAAIIFYIRRTYLKTVHESVQKGMFTSEDIYIYDQQTIDILLNKVYSHNKREVIYALNLLENASYHSIDKIMEEQLLQPGNIEVKKYVLERLEAKNKLDPLLLKEMVSDDANADLKQKLIALLCKNDPQFLLAASEAISDSEYETRKILIINLLNQREFNYLYKAGNELNNLLSSNNPIEKELAIEIISEVKHVQFAGALQELLNDPDNSVRRSAVLAICKLKLKQMLPAILKFLEDPVDKYMVLKGLLLYGDQLYQDIELLTVEVLDFAAPDLIKISSKIKGPHSTAFLLSMINESLYLKDKIIHALWCKEYEAAQDQERTLFTGMLNNHLRSGISKIKDHHEIPNFKDRHVIKSSLLNEVKSDLVMALKICFILYRKKEINRIMELMVIEKNEKLFNALEMLELLLPKKTAIELNQLFDFVLDPVTKRSVYLERPVNLLFNKVIFNDTFTFNPWTRAVCVYYSWKQNDIELLHRIREKNYPNEPFIIKETKEYVLNATK